MPDTVIDLHLHTTASDGSCSPEELVQRAFQAGVRTLSVTDHDTMQGVPEAARAAAVLGVELVPGIEITAVWQGRDVHVLGYFLDPAAPQLRDLLTSQQAERVQRAREIGHRLAGLGAPIDIEALILRGERDRRTIARPVLAQALVDAGHAATIAEAFDRFLGEHGPAYVPHRGLPPVDVVRLICKLRGLASLAHPGVLKRDQWIPMLVDAGLQALEVYHSEHDDTARAHYLTMARSFDLSVSGGSDYHGPGKRREEWLGRVGLPPADFITLCQRAGRPTPADAHERLPELPGS